MACLAAEHDVVLPGLGDGIDREGPSLLARGWDMPYQHPRYPGFTEIGVSAHHTEVSPQEGDELAEMVSVVLRETENVWNQKFPEQFGSSYREPQLVLFSGAVQSACGVAGAAVGPFYCPPDQKLYIDLSFYQTLRDRLGAPGDFAQAYVIAHEVGHHVQNLTGTADQVRAAQARGSQRDANELSVRMELQADCYAGIWAHEMRGDDFLQTGDIEEAMNAASAIGDDALQQQSGTVRPETFTHGTSEQRVSWFRRGYETGDVAACDTFR
ncbi:MAG: zinc metallopeptidase [Acidobacteria bacterium]|nr:zinc metallopeptidase [Acidobacteriota bacterium]